MAVEPGGFAGDAFLQTARGRDSPGRRRNGGASGPPASIGPIADVRPNGCGPHHLELAADQAALRGGGPGRGRRSSSPEQTQTRSASRRPLVAVTQPGLDVDDRVFEAERDADSRAEPGRQAGDDLPRVDADLLGTPERELQALLPDAPGRWPARRPGSSNSSGRPVPAPRRRIRREPGPHRRGRPGAASPVRPCQRPLDGAPPARSPGSAGRGRAARRTAGRSARACRSCGPRRPWPPGPARRRRRVRPRRARW